MEDTYIYGPVIKSSGFLMSVIDNAFYILKLDPDPNKSPYFGLNRATTTEFTLKTDITSSGKYTLKTSDGKGFQKAEDGYVQITSNANGEFDYIYTQNVTTGTGLYYGNTYGMKVKDSVLNFPWKTEEDESLDRQAYLLDPEDYNPTYSGSTTSVFLIPLQGYVNGGCELFDNIVLLAYSTDTRYKDTYFSTLEFCKAGASYNLCISPNLCGQHQSDGLPCLGPCESGYECLPREGSIKCADPDVPDKGPIYTRTWFIVLMVILGLVVFGVIVYLIYYSTKPKPKKPQMVYRNE